MALTPEQTRAMLDSLFAMPDKAKVKPKAKPSSPARVPTPRPLAIRTTLGLTSQGFLPAMKLLTIMHQHCDCCNSDSEYILPAVIRFESRKGAAIEIPAAVEQHLPVSVKEDWQTVQQCPSCIRISRNIQDLFSFAEPGCTQMELFPS
jgi:hypothetical protein